MLKMASEERAGAVSPNLSVEPDGSELRRGGVYMLPDGKEVVVGVRGDDRRCFLYHPLVWLGSPWIISMPIAYEVAADGSVKSGKGQPTCWRVEDLVDTGRSCDHDKGRGDQRRE